LKIDSSEKLFQKFLFENNQKIQKQNLIFRRWQLKRKAVIILCCVLIFCCFCLIEITISKFTYRKNKEQSEIVLSLAHELVDNNSITSQEVDVYNEKNERNENDILGVLYINKLKIEAPIKEGTTQEVMKTSVGHFVESDFWNGNVALASHNSGTCMHYFKDINKLQINDEIRYKTVLGEKTYKVQTIEKISDTDWSKVVGSQCNEINTLTLITCIDGQPDYRLCVQGKEI
jgi:sortase A